MADVAERPASGYSATTSELWAGAASRIVLPPTGIAHAGWSNQLHEVSTGNHEDLAVSALVVGSSKGPIGAVVVFEVCVLTAPEVDLFRSAIARELDLPTRAVRVSATHTHACPALNEVTGSWIRQGRDLVSDYRQLLLERSCEAAFQARSSMRPATVATASGSCTIPVYRRVLVGTQIRVGSDFAAPVDHTVSVVRIDDENLDRIATLVGMGAHPTVLSGSNTLVSADYPGEARRVVERATGAPCVFLQGAAADVGPRRTFTDELRDVESLGRELGYLALSLAEAADDGIDENEAAPTVDGTWLAPATAQRPQFTPADAAVASIDVPLAVRSDLGDPDTLEKQAHCTEAALDGGRRSGASDAEIRTMTIAAKRAAMAVDRRRAIGDRTECPIEVHVIRLGDVALAAWPVEPFWRSSQRVASESPLPVTVLSGYSNGYYQYLPRLEDFEVGGYEIEMSPFMPGAAERLEDATVDLCRRVATPIATTPPSGNLRVLAAGLDHPEGIAVAPDGHLWTGGEAGQVYRISPTGESYDVVARLESQVLGVAIDNNGHCICCTRGGKVMLVSPAGRVSLVFDSVDGRSLRLPNFPAFDSQGRLFVSGSGDYGRSNGEIYCYEDGAVSLFHPGPLPYPNGLAVSPDGKYLYVAQTATDNVVRFRLDVASAPESELVCPPGSLPTMPDGLAFDANGSLYATCYGTDCVYRVDLGEKPVKVIHDDRAIAINRVTNCAFARQPSTDMYLANLGGTVLSVFDVGVPGLPLRVGEVESEVCSV